MTIETQTTRKITEVVVVRDKAIWGMIGDFFMYGCMLAIYWVNYNYLGNSWFIGLVFSFLIIAAVFNQFAHKHYHRFNSYDEAIKFMQESKEKEDK